MESLQDMENGGHSQNPSCPICWEEFKEPKVLTCGHSFCCRCLTQVNGSDGRYLKCPKCNTKVRLPPSGRVEDFTTNFELMNLTSDQALDQTRRRREVVPLVPLKRRKLDTESKNCHCHQHKIPMKFYCETCKIQVCAECLLGNHEVGQHRIVSAAQVAANLSDRLQRLNEKLQYSQKDKNNIQDKIPAGRQDCQKEKQRLKGVVNNYRQTKTQQLQRATYEMENKVHEILQQIKQLQLAADEMQNKIHANQQEMQKVQTDADKMCHKIEEKAAAFEHTYDILELRYSYLNTLQYHFQKDGTALGQLFQHHDLTHAGEIEQVYKYLEQFKSCTDSLKTDLQKLQSDSQSNPIGLSIHEAKREILGIKLYEL